MKKKHQTVAELIKELQKLKQDLPICMEVYTSCMTDSGTDMGGTNTKLKSGIWRQESYWPKALGLHNMTSPYYTGYTPSHHCPGCQCFVVKPQRSGLSEKVRQSALQNLRDAEASHKRADSIRREPVFSIFGIGLYMDGMDTI